MNLDGLSQLQNFRFPLPVLLIILVWTLYWKWRALWAASKNNQKYWFTALLVINSLGILEIVYLQFFQKKLFKK